MKIKNIKINSFIFSKNISQRGIALLFSMMLSAIFLTVAIGISSIAAKELNFSTSSKDTNNAFYAADTGVECALYNDKADILAFVDTNSTGQINCFGNVFTLKSQNEIDLLNFSFSMSGLGSSGNSCVKVNVIKQLDVTAEPYVVTSTKITSKGYSLGEGEECTSSVMSRIERVLEVSY
jgi:Tfp pilus assembly protein PilX